jgi:hypothetical protein
MVKFDSKARWKAHTERQTRVYDDAGNVIETHEHAGEFKDRDMLEGEDS